MTNPIFTGTVLSTMKPSEISAEQAQIVFPKPSVALASLIVGAITNEACAFYGEESDAVRDDDDDGEEENSDITITIAERKALAQFAIDLCHQTGMDPANFVDLLSMAE